MVATRTDIIVNFITKGVDKLRNELGQFNKAMSMPLKRFREMETKSGKLNKSFGVMQSKGGRLGATFRMLTHGFRGFRMEMLGVMFFGMGISRFFMGLLQPSMQLVGIFELFSQTLGIFFLPIVLALLEPLLKIMEWFLNLPEGVQMAIGVFVIIGAILGKILFLTGMFALGLGSLVLVFGSVGAGLAVLGLIFGGIIAVILVVVAVIIVLWAIWTTNFLGMKDLFIGVWTGIVNIFVGAWMIIKGVWDIIAGIFTGDWKRVWEGVKGIFIGAWKLIVEGIGRVVWEIIKFIAMLPIRIIKYLIEFTVAILGAVVWLWVHRDEWIPKVLDALAEAGKKMIEWAKNIGKAIWNAILESLSAIKGWGGGLISKLTGGKQTPIGKQIGGFIPHTGLYKLHAGESVNQAGTFNSSPTINVYASAGMDIDRLVREISMVVTRDLASLARR